MRAALYFTPPEDAELSRLAARWLGRDAFANAPARDPDPRLDRLVAEPARYGFHATMKAPFRLAEGTDLGRLDAGLAAFCATHRAATIERLALFRLGSFFALIPETEKADLSGLADAVVEGFEPFRAPLLEAELGRRNPERLTARQRDHLRQWGYPYVFEDFRFHMTLTGSVDPAEADAVEAELGERFASVIGAPLAVDGLAVFVEPEPGAPFRIHSRHSLQPAC